LPISLEEFDKLEEKRKKALVVDWDEVIKRIKESEKYWSVNEVHNDLVHHKVTRFRVKVVLDKAVKEGKLTRGYIGRAFYYGKPIWRKKK